MNTVHAYIVYSKTYSNLDPTALQPFAGKAKKIIQEFKDKFSEPCMIDPAWSCIVFGFEPIAPAKEGWGVCCGAGGLRELVVAAELHSETITSC